MAKRLVVFSDGTWNQWKDSTSTNVVRLYQVLERIPGEQLLEYDSGVGTNFLKFTGGAFGVGISRNIKQLYRFIAANYEPGDGLYLFGFSRGAFTVRSLAGLLEVCGILRPERKALVHRAFDLYKQGATGESEHFRDAYSHRDFEIRVLGVWDTVGALGVPFATLNRFNPFSHRFHDTRLGKRVRYAFHAVALDENRAVFRPTLWSESQPPESEEEAPEAHIEQVWFPGVHADIGGGYTYCGLADTTLDWMIRRLRRHAPELKFRPESRWPFQLRPDPAGVMHDERRHVYRLWRHYYRTVKSGARVHASVLARKEQPQMGYEPANLPPRIEVVGDEVSD